MLTKSEREEERKKLNQFLKVERMNPERLKKFKGLEHYSTKQAENAIEMIEMLFEGIFDHLSNSKSNNGKFRDF
ncbi:hypothetical protein [Aquimarina algicola]|uniref:Uncharacterized protein n=1 Tax=Aquimarina algicola TaxID=2589995 RepID=A0A504JBC9_9FLAO|nr:hypothetical protein [Aquimarina algicola]TPN85832.1 hypothetical protein FHK87_11120 [Aquimarina algicola]